MMRFCTCGTAVPAAGTRPQGVAPLPYGAKGFIQMVGVSEAFDHVNTGMSLSVISLSGARWALIITNLATQSY